MDFLLSGFVAHGNFGEVFVSNAVVQIGQRRFFPDLSYLATAHFGRMQGGRVMGPVDLAVEVLSDSTRYYDRGEKRQAYREGRVPEIWLIDPDCRQFEADCLVEMERYSTEVLSQGRWTSRVLPGFWIDVAWFWAEALPNRLNSLQDIIATYDAAR